MSDSTLDSSSGVADRPLVWLHGEVCTPPFGEAARREAGLLLRRLQRGEYIGMPHARPMPVIGVRCLELRVVDASVSWRIIVRTNADAVIILAVFAKKTPRTPTDVIDACRRRLRKYDAC